MSLRRRTFGAVLILACPLLAIPLLAGIESARPSIERAATPDSTKDPIGAMTVGAEICDDIDDNGDGTIDELCDQDEDEWCDANRVVIGEPSVCSHGGGDCNDLDPSINPGAPEVCNDRDENCDGSNDEGDPGGGAPCDTGQPGVCSAGTVTCEAGSLECLPDVASSSETCDDLDNDCDGSVDEGLGSTTCGTGACQRTVQNCVGGDPQTCAPGLPSGETCNLVDDDCDGTTDEGNPGGGGPCTTGQPGVCSEGILTCQGGSLHCVRNEAPSPEACDTLDNDCDGSVDDGLGSTACGVGACRRTVQNCVGGVPQSCVAGQPSTETCNSIDDDCDGSVDENLGSSTCGVGACRRTVQNCVDGDPQSCVAGQPSTETCNSIDDDCDGSADENLGSSTCGVGACRRTVQNCVDGDPQSCVAGQPSTETCNTIDDDCDGSVDEGCGAQAHDLAVVKIYARKNVLLVGRRIKTKRVYVEIENRSPHTETIQDMAMLGNLVNLTVGSLGGCPNLDAELLVGAPQTTLPRTLEPKDNLKVFYSVTFSPECINDPLKSKPDDPDHEDYTYTASVNHQALDGQVDVHSVDDVCPRVSVFIDPYPDGKIKDKGCGRKRAQGFYGSPVLTDIFRSAE